MFDKPHDDIIKWKHFSRYWPFVLWYAPEQTVEQTIEKPVIWEPSRSISFVMLTALLFHSNCLKELLFIAWFYRWHWIIFVRRPRSSWRLHTTWRQIGTRSSPTIMLTTASHEPHYVVCTSRYTDEINYLTHWGRDKMAAISQTTLSIAFSWMKMLEFRLNFHWSLFLRVRLRIFHHWFR